MQTALTTEWVRVPERFCGPPQSGNGGYTCGLLAQALPDASAVECTIRRPIPIDREMRVFAEGSRARLMDGEVLVIEAVGAELDLELPAPVAWEEAVVASKRSPAFQDHPFPTCFVCGPDRSDHDGLRLFPGMTSKQNGFESFFAAAWVPAAEFAHDGFVRTEIIWAAMDCPTGFAAGFPWAGKLVTGRLTVKLLAPVPVHARCVIQSWSLGDDGRKCHAGAVLRSGLGDTHAIAKATWIRI